MTIPRYYTGLGAGTAVGGEPPRLRLQDLNRPDDYLASPDLAAAVDVALTLGMPLLLTGEPGSGKSALADSVANELRLGHPRPARALRFPVKSTTEARDLFYTFDTVGRFHASQTPGADADARDFIHFQALGLALLRAKPSTFARQDLALHPDRLDLPEEPVRSVVLIDEIDKAPRDVPNDILVELETMAFDIPELAAGRGRVQRVALDPNSAEAQRRPLVIFTSNREQTLPEPFLRRCVFHHLSFPPFRAADARAITVEKIVARRLGNRYSTDDSAQRQVRQAIDFFHYLRKPELENRIGRRPTLAELLNWLDWLLPPLSADGTAAGTSDWQVLAALDAVQRSAGADPAEPLSDDEASASHLLQLGIDSLLLKRPRDAKAVSAETLLRDWAAAG
jgi:MoxR-like ATPase